MHTWSVLILHANYKEICVISIIYTINKYSRLMMSDGINISCDGMNYTAYHKLKTEYLQYYAKLLSFSLHSGCSLLTLSPDYTPSLY